MGECTDVRGRNMLSERVLHLINAEIDGELATGEHEELDAALGSSGEARAMKAELQKLANLLDATPAEDPPPDLAGHILNYLPPGKERYSPLADLFTPFRPVPVGLAFAAGLLLTISAYHTGSTTVSMTDSENMTGTMLARPEERGVLLDSIEVTDTEITGVVSLREREGVLVLEFDLEPGAPAEIEIRLDEAGLGFGGIALVSPGHGDMNGSYEVSEGTLRIVNQGRHAFSVLLPAMARREAGGRKIRIELSTGGTQLHSVILRG